MIELPKALDAMTVTEAAEVYLVRRRQLVAPRTVQLDLERLVPIRRALGGCRLSDLTPEDLITYQQLRREQVSGRTVNMELGLLRRILKRARLWSADFQEEIRNLPEHSSIARVLTPEEKEHLFRVAASRRRWLVAFLAAEIASCTTCRGIELKSLRWENVDFTRAMLLIRRSKGRTAGIRALPLNAQALAAFRRLRERAEKNGLYRPLFYVFPAREAAGLHRRLVGDRPQRTWRSAWRSLTRAAGLAGLRFHDLRHQAITELSECGVSDAVLMGLAGHSSRSMLDTYTHVRMPALREAVNRLGLVPLPLASARLQ
jgi:integrase